MKGNKIKDSGQQESINKLFDLDFAFKKESIPKLIPFIVFITLLIIFYIANRYYAEESAIEESKLKQELKDLRAESLTIKAKLMDKTKRSEVAKLVDEIGLKDLDKPAKKIVVKKGEY